MGTKTLFVSANSGGRGTMGHQTFRTITAAIQAILRMEPSTQARLASPWEISVEAGVYEERVTLYPGMTLQGSGLACILRGLLIDLSLTPGSVVVPPDQFNLMTSAFNFTVRPQMLPAVEVRLAHHDLDGNPAQNGFAFIDNFVLENLDLTQNLDSLAPIISIQQLSGFGGAAEIRGGTGVLDLSPFSENKKPPGPSKRSRRPWQLISVTGGALLFANNNNFQVNLSPHQFFIFLSSLDDLSTIWWFGGRLLWGVSSRSEDDNQDQNHSKGKRIFFYSRGQGAGVFASSHETVTLPFTPAGLGAVLAQARNGATVNSSHGIFRNPDIHPLILARVGQDSRVSVLLGTRPLQTQGQAPLFQLSDPSTSVLTYRLCDGDAREWTRVSS